MIIAKILSFCRNTLGSPSPPVLGISISTGDRHSKYDQILLVKKSKYIGFCTYHRSYLLCPRHRDCSIPDNSNSAVLMVLFFVPFTTVCASFPSLPPTTAVTITHIRGTSQASPVSLYAVVFHCEITSALSPLVQSYRIIPFV